MVRNKTVSVPGRWCSLGRSAQHSQPLPRRLSRHPAQGGKLPASNNPLRWVQRAFPVIKSPGVMDSHPLMKDPTLSLLKEPA